MYIKISHLFYIILFVLYIIYIIYIKYINYNLIPVSKLSICFVTSYIAKPTAMKGIARKKLILIPRYKPFTMPFSIYIILMVENIPDLKMLIL